MNPQSLYAFYGSLRRGMLNYPQFESGLEFQFEEVVTGFQMYAMEHYPYVIRTNNTVDRVMVEVYRVTDVEVERAIHDLELGVGYTYEEVMIRGKQVGIYVFEKRGSETLVKDGDWVKFFGSR